MEEQQVHLGLVGRAVVSQLFWREQSVDRWSVLAGLFFQRRSRIVGWGWRGMGLKGVPHHGAFMQCTRGVVKGVDKFGDHPSCLEASRIS